MMTIYLDSCEEFDAVNEMLTEMRAKKAREQVVAKAKAEYELAVSNLIAAIGTEDAKRIMREMRTRLRQTEIEIDPYHSFL